MRSACRIPARVALPDVLECSDPELVLVVEGGLVHAAHVLLAVGGDEVVVGLARLPAVDDEVAVRYLDVAEKLGADIATAAAEELRPLAFGAVDLLELGRFRRVVAEDERDQRRPPRSWWALKKFSLPAVAIEAEALISRQSAAAATIWAKR
jgi:hypothetical protein